MIQVQSPIPLVDRAGKKKNGMMVLKLAKISGCWESHGVLFLIQNVA